jgi:hypothetical protein
MKQKGFIEIGKLEFDDNSEEHLKRYREEGIPVPKIDGFYVDFSGHNEGSGSPCADKQEVDETVQQLLERHKEIYDIKIINTLEVQHTL